MSKIITMSFSTLSREAPRHHVSFTWLCHEDEQERADEVPIVTDLLAVQTQGLTCEVRPMTLAGELALSLMAAGA